MTVVKSLSFRTSQPQEYDDQWRRKVRTCVFTGACTCCRRRTYEFTDGENDPRGPLGDHANHALEPADYAGPATLLGAALKDAGLTEADVERFKLKPFPLCAICGNEEGPYKMALERAQRSWSKSVQKAVASS